MKLPRFIGSSVRSKTMAVVLATVFAALFVDTLALLVYELRTYREARLDDLSTQAEILGRATGPAIAFDDRKDAGADLATLRARTDILAAALYAADGSVFASYARDPENLPLPAGVASPAMQVDGDLLRVSRDIVEGGQKVGTVYVVARSGLYERIVAYLGILVAIMGLAFGAALLLSLWLQKVLTDPILAVASAARRVVERRDLGLRAEKTTEDEIGVLADAFNRMLDEVAARQDELRAADRRKDEFLATLAHELRNPLAPIRNALFIMKLAPGDERAAAQSREMIDRQVGQMVRLVDDLIDVSRVTTGKLTLRRERVEVGAAARSALEAVEPLARARGHSIVTRLPAEPAYLNADPIRLSQVFLNLLNNAVKFTDSGGEIRFECALEGEELVARVCDNGIGIAPDMLESIFDMFAQADRSLERSTAGLGVGLALSRRLVELHGGSIVAKSAGIGQGSEFTVRIPVPSAQASARLAGPGRQAENGAARKQRILLVDDNEDYAMSLATVLGAMKHDVRVAHDGASGLAMAREFRPEFAFLDIGMPKMNGFQLARRLREAPETAATILVAVTGFSQPSDREAGRRAGFDTYLVKPVEIDRLKEILEKA
jgi:two-component system, sensor histidine kinase